MNIYKRPGKEEVNRLVGLGMLLAGDEFSKPAQRVREFIDTYNRIRERDHIQDNWRSIKNLFHYRSMSRELKEIFKEFLFLEVHK